MSQNHRADEPAILYVDDEEQALKYFKKSFDGDFKILTAESADKAEALVNSGTEHIGIVISDQRMPGRTGASLLSALRVSHPQIVRLVTTAFSDLESAIESVNSGEVLRYIVKPWDIDALSLDLRTAMQIYNLQKERKELLEEKLSVQQSITAVDRLRTLIVACSGLRAYPHADWSACRYGEDIGHLRQSFEKPAPQALDLWKQAEAETLFMRSVVSDLSSLPAPQALDGGTANIATAWSAAVKNSSSDNGEISLPSPQELDTANAGIPESWLAAIFENAIQGMSKLVSSPKVAAQKNGDGTVTITLSGKRREDAELPVMIAPAGDTPPAGSSALLKAYLMLGETSGAISLRGGSEDLQLEMNLSEKPAADEDRNGAQKIKQCFRSYEIWPQ